MLDTGCAGRGASSFRKPSFSSDELTNPRSHSPGSASLLDKFDVFECVFIVGLQFEDFSVENKGKITPPRLLEKHGKIKIGSGVFALQIDRLRKFFGCSSKESAGGGFRRMIRSSE